MPLNDVAVAKTITAGKGYSHIKQEVASVDLKFIPMKFIIIKYIHFVYF